MKRSNRLIILIGVLLAVMGGLGAVVVAGGGSGGGGTSAGPTATPEATTTVVIATRDINFGDRITSDMVEEKTVKISVRDGYGSDTYTSAAEVIGANAGAKITAGQPLTRHRDILTAGTMPDGKSIAGSIAPGYVAISIEVDQVNGVGTIITMGDRVNVILSVYTPGVALAYKNKEKETILDLKDVTEPSVKLVIQNRKVLGTIVTPSVSEKTQAPAAAASGEATAGPTSANVELTDRHMIVILEVKSSEAEVIRWAQRAEKPDPQNYISMALVLRSEKDNTVADVTTTGITFKMLVDKWGVLPVDGRAYIPSDIMQLINRLASW